jgi:hypothetical protein
MAKSMERQIDQRRDSEREPERERERNRTFVERTRSQGGEMGRETERRKIEQKIIVCVC